MIGAFRPTSVNMGGLLWKHPWRLSPTRKANQRKRLQRVDSVIEAVRASGVQCRSLDLALDLKTEKEMNPKDKYTMYSATSVGLRKSISKLPKFTRLTHRENPIGF